MRQNYLIRGEEIFEKTFYTHSNKIIKEVINQVNCELMNW